MSKLSVVQVCCLFCVSAFISSLGLAGGTKNHEEFETVMALETDKEYGAYLAAECMTCHIPGGVTKTIPQVLGKEKAYLVNALLEYKHLQRDNDVMRGIAGSLTNEDIAALAAYLSAE